MGQFDPITDIIAKKIELGARAWLFELLELHWGMTNRTGDLVLGSRSYLPGDYDSDLLFIRWAM